MPPSKAAKASRFLRIPKPTPPVDNAEHLAKFVATLDWLKRAQATELRDKQRAAVKGP
jgi:hypothetical protein